MTRSTRTVCGSRRVIGGGTSLDEMKSRREIVAQIDALRDEVSGVSLDEEAMNLLKFQRAYEANARFFTMVDRTIEMLLNMVR